MCFREFEEIVQEAKYSGLVDGDAVDLGLEMVSIIPKVLMTRARIEITTSVNSLFTCNM